jgi:dTDP-4-amino-4,6-dideoxygalactose transaminase
MSMNIPFLDLITPNLELEDELLGVVRKALKSAAFIGGPAVEQFERDFAAFCDTPHAVGVSSGTDALRFALMAVGVRPGDAVVTVPNTFIATTEAISQAGGRPVFVDVSERTYTLNPDRLRGYLETDCRRDSATGRAIDKRTGSPVTAVVPVHLYGQMADMDAIAAEYNFAIVEDACQAHGAEYYSQKAKRWQKAGSVGRAAAFSFYPGKNLGACGEAGAITTTDESVARTCRMLRDHGQSKKYYHDLEGYNGRLDAIQAGMLSVKLTRLASWNEQRRDAAQVYDGLLASLNPHLEAPHVPTWSRPVFHLYVVRVEDRDGLQKDLTAAGIGTGIHYPICLHLSTPYQSLGYGPGSFPVAERAAAGILSLPMFPGLTRDNQEHVANAVAQSLAALGRLTPA